MCGNKKNCECIKQVVPKDEPYRFKQRLDDGGYVLEHPNMTYRERMDDSVMSRLKAGSLVIPVKYTSMVLSNFPELRHYREKTDDKNMVDVVLMPNEVVVPPKKAKQVIQYLRGQGIRLPNT